MRPVLCMITDRRRAASEDDLVARVGAAARAGIHLVQVRERDLEGGALLRLVERCLAATRGTATRILVNERLDVALAAGAHGVHLRSDSLPARRARAIAPPGFLIGRSVHEKESARVEAEGADYLLVGTVFESGSKPGRAPAGVGRLADIAAATSIPVLAVGGVTLERAGDLVSAGVAGLAAIGMFADTPVQSLAALVAGLIKPFDSRGSVPRQ